MREYDYNQKWKDLLTPDIVVNGKYFPAKNGIYFPAVSGK